MTKVNFEFIYDEDFLNKMVKICSSDMDQIKELYKYLQAIRPLKEKILKNVKCKRCGECCKSCNVMLTKQDIIRLCKHLKCDFEELYDKYMDKSARAPYLKLPCPFFTENSECSIYNARPRVCREFPFNEFFLIVDPCPLGKELRQICESIKGPMIDTNGELQTMADERREFAHYMMGNSHADTRTSLCMVINKDLLRKLIKALKERRKIKSGE